jgi:ketosteroid isomerase-like protein
MTQTIPESDSGSGPRDHTSAGIVRALLDHLNAHDRQGFMSLLARDAMQTEPATGLEFRGPREIAANFWSYRSTFPDLQVTVTNLFACGKQAVAELTLRGTYEPYTYGQSARTISWRGCLVMEIEGEKVTSIALYADRLNMLDQLGALPLAPEAPTSDPHGFYYRRLEPVVTARIPARRTGNGQADPHASREGAHKR